MRLLTKTMLYFLLAMLLVLVTGAYFFFRHFSNQINERADKELMYEEVQWIQYLEAATANSSNFILRSPNLLIYPTQDSPSPYAELSTTRGRKAKANVQVPFRQLSHVVSIHGIPYRIVIRQSQEQKLALVSNITYILLLVFAGLLIAALLFNWLISNRLWRPFRQSLQQVQHLELQKMENTRFATTNIEEFNELNASLNSMVQKMQRDYLNMKEFTENAAHEMQTPLAVAQSKLELLLQDNSLNDVQIGAIAQATDALSRLGKLNQALLLLAKIENNQFEATQHINLATITRKYLNLFDELIRDKNLELTTNIEADFNVLLHPFLADSLVSNLLGNAIKYNHEHGKLNIHITHNQYCVSNTSNLHPIEAQNLFKRFKTLGDGTAPATGLGLAIVKRIADNSGLHINYSYETGQHSFCLNNNKG